MKNSTESVDDVLIIRYLKHLNLDCLGLAIECKCEKFVSNSIIQNIIDKIWTNGKTNNVVDSVIESSFKNVLSIHLYFVNRITLWRKIF